MGAKAGVVSPHKALQTWGQDQRVAARMLPASNSVPRQLDQSAGPFLPSFALCSRAVPCKPCCATAIYRVITSRGPSSSRCCHAAGAGWLGGLPGVGCPSTLSLQHLQITVRRKFLTGDECAPSPTCAVTCCEPNLGGAMTLCFPKGSGSSKMCIDHLRP